MGVFQKPDGRFLVGIEIENGNEYRNSNAYRDIVIQLTQSGATPQSMEYLAFLLDYATSHYAAGEPISPPNVSVFVSANGFVKAIQADDFTTDGTNFEVGGIKWNGSVWDFSDAGQSGGGSSTLSGLTDVDITNPTDGQTLVYNATSGKWENGAGGGGGLVVNVIEHNDGEYSSLDKTAGEIYSAFNTGKHISFRQSHEVDGITTFEIGVMSVVEHGTIDSGPFEGMEAFTFVLDNGQHFVGGQFQTIGADTFPATNFNPGPPAE